MIPTSNLFWGLAPPWPWQSCAKVLQLLPCDHRGWLGCWLTKWWTMRNICLPPPWTITWVRIVAISTFCPHFALAFALARHQALIYSWCHVQTTLTQTFTIGAEQPYFLSFSFYVKNPFCCVSVSPSRSNSAWVLPTFILFLYFLISRCVFLCWSLPHLVFFPL